MRIYSKNGKWYYEFMVNGKRKHGACKNCFDEKSAKLYMTNNYNMCAQSIVNPKVTVELMLSIYSNHAKTNNRSWNKKDYMIKILKEYLDVNKDITSITVNDINVLKRKLKAKRKLSNATVNRYIATLSKAFNLVICSYNLHINNPCKYSKKLDEVKRDPYILSIKEQNLLIKNSPQYLKDMIVCSLTTGLRKGNILNLKWNQINLRNNIISILPQDNKGKKRIYMKLSKSMRKIILRYKKELKKDSISKFIFINPKTNKPYTDIRKSFNTAKEKAGITGDFIFHDLRHNVATRLINNDTDIETVKELLAHSDVGTTQIYLHTNKDNISNAIDILDTFI